MSSHIATVAAIRHPLRGDVSVQLPVPKSPLHAKRAANQRFALSALLAILQLELLYPPLNLGNRPRVLEQFAEGIPLALGEVDGHTVVPELKRKLRTTFFFGDCHEEVPTTPRMLCRPSFEQGPKLSQGRVASHQIVEAASGAEVDIHAQLRGTCRRKRELQVIDLERIRQDNPAAKVIVLRARRADRLAVVPNPMSPRGEAPKSRPIGGKDLIEPGAVYSFIPNRGE